MFFSPLAKRCLIDAYFSPDSRQDYFFLEKEMLWIEDSYFSRKQQFEVKNVLIIDLFITLVDRFHYLWIIVMFLSVFWTLILTKPIHSKLEDPLVSK